MMTVLLVEDDSDTRQLVKRGLEGRYSILEAETLAKAKSILCAVRPDVLLLDLNLPDSNGISTIRTMQIICPDVPMVVYSGFLNGEFSEIEVIHYGAQDVLRKGHSDLEDMKWAIHTAIARHEVRGTLAPIKAAKKEVQETLQSLKEVPKERS